MATMLTGLASRIRLLLPNLLVSVLYTSPSVKSLSVVDCRGAEPVCDARSLTPDTPSPSSRDTMVQSAKAPRLRVYEDEDDDGDGDDDNVETRAPCEAMRAGGASVRIGGASRHAWAGAPVQAPHVGQSIHDHSALTMATLMAVEAKPSAQDADEGAA
ncbi:hypothetical protein SMMN14_02743 [Sphaerulina musiva]